MDARSKWIWKKDFSGEDIYVDFLSDFDYTGGKVTVKISADSNYALYINGVFSESGQYADFPHYKVYDEFEITDLCKEGKNRFAVTVWHYGRTSLCYYPGRAALRFEIWCDGELIAFSDEGTLCRQSCEYQSGLCKQITSQLGFSFHYDATEDDGWRVSGVNGFERAVTVDQDLPMNKRPIKKLLLGKRAELTVVKSEGGKHYLYNIGYEEVGYLTMKVRSEKKQKIIIAWGEHIEDGCVRRLVGDRDFSVEVTVGEGETVYMNPYRRLGLQYLEVFAEEPIDVDYITVTPVYYPLDKVGNLPEEELDRKIYEVCVHTLELCMHEHYEDCPWREQALYCMDSRNQILCGYYAFEEYEFARASLKLISKDNRYDDLLAICYPSGNYNSDKGLVIPSFSLQYFIEMREYITRTGDTTLAEEAFDKLEAILGAFVSRLEDGCVPTFPGVEYWNFYEWTSGLDGTLGRREDVHVDACLNTLLIIAIRCMSEISEMLGREDKYGHLIPEIKAAIRKRFFDGEKGLFYNMEGDERMSELVNSLCILSGVCTPEEAERIADELVGGSALIPTSLSMICFKYDALLKVGGERYKDYILNDIHEKYKPMLDEGATTFWEYGYKKTSAGSRCHGWSALPVYYYEIFAGKEPTSALK
ncbi:MAG: hypothetical protein E7611_08690 [Ruminococcaceae bacterium]|nr:hypothetical protein [Oscillospiraceae bacterium]